MNIKDRHICVISEAELRSASPNDLHWDRTVDIFNYNKEHTLVFRPVASFLNDRAEVKIQNFQNAMLRGGGLLNFYPFERK